MIGDASYSIYLVHFFFQKRVSNGLRSLDWIPAGEKTQAKALLLLAVIMAISVACGIIIHKWIEKPVLAKCREWLRIGGSARPHGHPQAQRATSPS